MKKFFSLAALMVCSVLGTMPARAQVPALAEGAELLVRTPEQLMYVIREMSAEALTFNGTLAALVANTELPRVSDITTFEQYLNTTWPARVAIARAKRTRGRTVAHTQATVVRIIRRTITRFLLNFIPGVIIGRSVCRPPATTLVCVSVLP